jgi:D-hydroxyproline dehydrogenase subunit gamma
MRAFSATKSASMEWAGSMFETLHAPKDKVVTVFIDGDKVVVPANVSVAAALLMQNDSTYHLSSATEEPRAPFCMIGNCYECLVTIDDQPNQQGCLVEVEDQMKIRRQIEPFRDHQSGAQSV